MKIENHLESLKESIAEIDEAITKGLSQKQRTLGFHTSAVAIDMLEIILHKNNLINPGFKNKTEALIFIVGDYESKLEPTVRPEYLKKLDKIRNKLCYGKKQEEIVLEKLTKDFNKLKEIFKEVSKYEL